MTRGLPARMSNSADWLPCSNCPILCGLDEQTERDIFANEMLSAICFQTELFFFVRIPQPATFDAELQKKIGLKLMHACFGLF